MNLSKWHFNNINEIGKNVKLNGKCREVYAEIDNSPIPILTDNLELQMKIEQLAINSFVRGFKKASRIYGTQIRDLKHQRKVYQQRVKGLEAIIKENGNE